ncbi:MAG: tetratricopeptide repeat protein [Candidatus Stahlbacteria bacterium]|nr:tetratricopeptide repeat protein [Candidatus Stahlbacteria bacterium]
METREERKLVTVIFADLSGFTKLSHTLDPEEVSEVANICFAKLDSIIIAHGGSIDKHEGDLVMALFGIPEAHEDDPERAVKSAMQMLQEMTEINQTVAQKIGIEVRLGLHIGVNMGEVVFTKVGSEHKEEHTVMGNAVNLAARLCSTANSGETIVSESVFNLSKYLFNYEVLKPVNLKGIGETKIFKPLNLKEIPESKRGIRGIYSPLVGRDNEFNLLNKLVRQKGKLIFISGNAGIGKSRLAMEIKKSVPDFLWIEGNCLSYGQDISYWPFKESIKKIFNIQDTDPPNQVKEKLVKAEFPSPYHDEVIPYIAYLLGSKIMDEKVKFLDPKDLKLQTFIAIQWLFNKVGESNSIFVIDDYHWIDDASLELLEFILNKPFNFTLIIISRPLDPVSQKIKTIKSNSSQLIEIELSSLSSDASATLVYNLLKIPGINEELKATILDKAAGNPFYMEEILKSLMESGYLVFRSGVWEAKEEIQKLTIPPTVQGVIASRIDSLPSEDKKVLQIAAVIGRNFYSSILGYVYPNNLSLHLNNLEELEFIYKEGDEYVFRHPLIHEVAYNMLLKRMRREWHKRVGECIEEFFKDRITDFYELLVLHYYTAQVWDKSYEYSFKSAKSAQRLYYNSEAIKLYDRAMESLKFIASTDEINKQRIEIIIQKAGLLAHIGQPMQGIAILDEGISISQKIDDKNSEAKCLLIKSEIYRAVSEYQKLIESADKAYKIFNAIGNTTGEANALTNIGSYYCFQNKYDDAMRYFLDSLKRIKNTDAKETEAKVFSNISVVYNQQGDFKKALKYTFAALEIAKKTGDKRAEAHCLANIGSLYGNTLDNYSEAMKYFSPALEIVEKIGYKRIKVITLRYMGTIHISLGNFSKAIEVLLSSLSLCEQIMARESQCWILLALGEANCRLGEYEVALKYCDEVLRVAEEIKYLLPKCSALLAMSDIYREKKELNRAEECLELVGKITNKGDNPDLLIENEIMYSEQCLATNNLQKADFHIKNALKLAKGVEQKGIVFLLLCRFNAAKNRWDEAKLNFSSATKVFRKLKMPYEEAKTYYYFGTALKLKNKEKDKASKYLDKARAIFERLGAKGWTKKFEPTENS